MESLAEYGVAIFAIAALVIVVLKFLAFMGNHIRHSTVASERLASAIEEMLKYLERRNGKGS